MMGRSKSSTLSFLKDKVRKTIQNWDDRWISQAGREILMKSVIQSLPTYAMSVFLLPMDIIKEFERMISKYWRGATSNHSRKIQWMSWSRLCRHKSTGGLGFRDFHDFNLALLVASKDTRAELAIICWAIWKARNNLVWNQQRSQIDSVVHLAKHHLKLWKNAQSWSSITLFQNTVKGDRSEQWVKPQTGVIKVTADGATFSEHDAYGYGLIARDSAGDLIKAKIRCKRGKVPGEFVEALEIKEALSWIKEESWSQVQLESDCLVIVQAIRGIVNMLSLVGSLVQECRDSLGSLHTTSLSFIKRYANMTAHVLARASYSFPDQVFNMRNVHIDVKNTLLSEL
ncbi:hypothetical protein AgCh_031966 [Apium graveolens]